MSLDERDIRASIGAVMLFQVCALFGSELLHLKLRQTGLSDTDAERLSSLVGFVILALLMLPILRKTWPALRSLFEIPKKYRAILPASAAIGVLIYLIYAIALIWVATLPWLGADSITQSATFLSTFNCANPKTLLIAIPLMSVLTPIVEETVNRGLIFFTLLPRGRLIAIFGSALLFSILHKPETIPIVFLFGVYAAVQVLYWKNLWAPIVTHGVFNALVQIDIHCIEKSWLPGSSNEMFVGSALISAAAVLVSALAIVWLTLKLKIRATAKEAAPIVSQ